MKWNRDRNSAQRACLALRSFVAIKDLWRRIRLLLGEVLLFWLIAIELKASFTLSAIIEPQKFMVKGIPIITYSVQFSTALLYLSLVAGANSG